MRRQGGDRRKSVRRYTEPLRRDGPRAAAPVVQMLPLVGVPYLKGSWDAGAHAKATKVVAKDLKLVKKGLIIPQHVNNATGVPSYWKQLRGWKMTHPAGEPGYVRMHLFHGSLGGSGKLKQNLAPGTNAMNQKHSRQVETPLMRALQAGGEVSTYTMVAKYQQKNLGLTTGPGKKAWKNTLNWLVCSAKYRPGAGKAFKSLKKTVTERLGLTVKPEWDQH